MERRLEKKCGKLILIIASHLLIFPFLSQPARQPPRPAKAETAAPLQKGIATAPELSEFKDFNAVHREKAITYWFIANYPGELWIEKAMDLLSAKYYNEYDFF